MKLTLNTYSLYISYSGYEGSGLFLAVKVPEERTGRILAEIDRAEKIFKKMCDCGELEEEIRKVSTAKQAAAVIKRSMR
jgi:hypothetical protein